MLGLGETARGNFGGRHRGFLPGPGQSDGRPSLAPGDGSVNAFKPKLSAERKRKNGPARCCRSAGGEFGKDPVESVGRLVLNPMPGFRDHLETGGGLNTPQGAGAIVEVWVGGGVALTPDAVDAGLDERKGAGERV